MRLMKVLSGRLKISSTELSLRTTPGGSKLAVHLIVLADENQGNCCRNHNDHGAPDEAEQETGQGGSHGEAADGGLAGLSLRMAGGFLRC